METSAYWLDRAENARKHLLAPNKRYPNGRMSHDVERDVLADAESHLADMRFNGYFDAHGQFIEYAN